MAFSNALLNEQILHRLQAHVPVIARSGYAEIVASVVREFAPPSQPAAAPLAGALAAEGLAHLGQVFTGPQVEEIAAHFLARPCFNSHVRWQSDQVPRLVGAGAENFHYGAYSLPDIIAAPYLLEFANSPEILAIAENYLGCVPTLYSLNAWWSFSGLGQADSNQEFHRDLDDFKFCTLFIYLTDVKITTGAHIFLRRSHNPKQTQAVLNEAAERLQKSGGAIALSDLYFGITEGYRNDPLYARAFKDHMEVIEGPGGTAFIADTAGVHQGLTLREGRRLMFWARYGTYKNPFVFEPPVDGAQVGARLPMDERTSYINRCIIAR